MSVRPQLGVGYARIPPVGVIETLHALDPRTGRAMCGQAVAIAWPAEDAADTEVDCRECLAVIAEAER